MYNNSTVIIRLGSFLSVGMLLYKLRLYRQGSTCFCEVFFHYCSWYVCLILQYNKTFGTYYKEGNIWPMPMTKKHPNDCQLNIIRKYHHDWTFHHGKLFYLLEFNIFKTNTSFRLIFFNQIILLQSMTSKLDIPLE